MTEDHERFVDVINEARERLEHSQKLLYSDQVSIFRVEAAALQLRLIIELVWRHAAGEWSRVAGWAHVRCGGRFASAYWPPHR